MGSATIVLLLIVLVIIGVVNVSKIKKSKENQTGRFIQLRDFENKRYIYLDVNKILYYHEMENDPAYSIVKLVSGEEIAISGDAYYLGNLIKSTK